MSIKTSLKTGEHVCLVKPKGLAAETGAIAQLLRDFIYGQNTWLDIQWVSGHVNDQGNGCYPPDIFVVYEMVHSYHCPEWCCKPYPSRAINNYGDSGRDREHRGQNLDHLLDAYGLPRSTS